MTIQIDLQSFNDLLMSLSIGISLALSMIAGMALAYRSKNTLEGIAYFVLGTTACMACIWLVALILTAGLYLLSWIIMAVVVVAVVIAVGYVFYKTGQFIWNTAMNAWRRQPGT